MITKFLPAICLALIFCITSNFIWFHYLDPKLVYTMRTAQSIAPTTLLLPIFFAFFAAFAIKEKISREALTGFIITLMLVYPALYMLYIYYIMVGHLPFI